jgi:post-segregation antitoxin (ccd killing protein)
MVIFNPQVPDINTPDWTNTSKPISQPEADKSKGIALSTIAGGLETGAKIAEDTMQDYLKEKVSAGVDALRDTSILAYQDIRNSQVTGTQPAQQAVQTAGFRGSLTQPNANSDIPEDLQAGLDRAGNIALAKSQRGAANDTLYTASLYALTKQLRNEYPGHKDFIDQQIARISGKNPANAYMDNLLSDINRASQGQDAFQKMILTKAGQNMGDAAVQKYLVAAQQGVPGAMSGLTNAVFQAEGEKAQRDKWRFENEQGRGDQAADADKAQGQYEVRAQQIIDKHINPVIEIPGLTQPATMQKLLQDSLNNKVPLTPEQKNAMLSSLNAAKLQAADDLQRSADNEGYSKRVRDPAKIQKIREDKLGYIDRYIDAITNDKYGSLFEAKRRATAMQDQTNIQALTSPIGQWAMDRAFFNEKLGPGWMNYLDSLGLSKGNLQQLQSFFNDSQVRASSPEGDVRSSGFVKSLYADLQKAKEAKQQGVKAPDAIYDNLVDNVNLIIKAQEQNKQDVAREVVKYTFDPRKNQNIMDFFGKDFIDGNGVPHNGKYAVYDTLTAPKVVDGVYNLRDRNSWNMMKDWQETSFKKLFGEEVANLQKIQGDKSMPMKIAYDSDTSQFKAVWETKPRTSVEANYQKFADEAIGKLNGGLRNLRYMHNKEGGDTNSYLFETLMLMGYSPNDRLHGDNLPQKVVEAIAASSKSNKARIEDAFKASRGD